MTNIKTNNSMLKFYGIGFIVLSIIMMLNPIMTISFVFKMYGLLLLVGGTLSLASLNQVPKEVRGLITFSSIVNILVGIFIFTHAALTAGVTSMMIIYLLAIALVVSGISTWKSSKSLSIFKFISAIFLVSFKLFAIASFVWVIAGLFLVAGIALLFAENK